MEGGETPSGNGIPYANFKKESSGSTGEKVNTDLLTVPRSSFELSQNGSAHTQLEHLESFWQTVNSSTSSQASKHKRKRRNAVSDAEEAGISKDTLVNLARIFREADVNGNGCLNLEEFKIVMRKTLTSDPTDEELDLMYMKTDTNCDGTVDWDEYLTFILLECKEKDTMAIQAQRTFQPSPRSIDWSQKLHKDSVVAILYQVISEKPKEEPIGRYITIGKDGVMIVWNSSTYEMVKRHKMQSDNKMVWVTDACLMPSINVVAVATTARTVNFYDICGQRINELSRIIALDSCPTCMYYWCCNTDADKSVMLQGDDRGGVTIIVFNACPLSTKINPKIMGIKKTIQKIHIASFIKGQVPMVKAVHLQNVHADLVRQVKYIPFLACFVSCCKDRETAMCMGNIDLQLNRKVLKTFRVKQGVNSFDYCQHLNMIVTGGYDTLIRVWNPYILSRPSSVLHGHQSPVLFVRINTKKEHVISISEIKEIRIHDLNNQNCIQKFYKKCFPDLGIRPISACLFNAGRQDFILATKNIMVIEGRENLWKDPLSMSQLDPITSALFNPLFNQVVSACWDGTVCTWNFITGEKQMQFKAYKAKHKICDAEITAMAFSPCNRRLITSSKSGCLRIWNFNNGSLLRELPNIENMEISSLIWVKQRIITGGWSQRVIIYLETACDDMISILNPYHKEDVMSLACYRGNILASACYNGDIYLWYMETGRLICVLNANKNTKRPLSPREHTGHHVQNPCIYYTNALEKNPNKVHELTPLPCYLRENPQVDLDHALTNTQSTRLGSVKESRHSVFSFGGRISSMKRKASKIDKFTHYNKTPSKRSQAIEKMVFLENRENTAGNATLLTAGMNGIINAWSLHPTGGLRGSFNATREKKQPVTAMTYIKELELLITGDIRGYIRVWDINHFCTENDSCNTECQNKWNHFTFVKYKRKLYSLGKYHTLFPHLYMDIPHLITSFRGHLKSVTWLEYVPNIKGQELFLSTSLDCSIRLWGLDGEFFGVYSQKELWNLAGISLPHWRNGCYDNFEDTQNKSIERYKKVILPRDVQKVASSTTMVVLLGGRRNYWNKVKNVLSLIIKLKRRQRIPQIENIPSAVRIGLSMLEEERHIEHADLDIPALLEECRRKKTEVPKNEILGMSYKKRTNHRPLPKLKIPLAMEPQCAVYRALPYHELDDVECPMKQPEIKLIRKTHRLPPIRRDGYNRPRTHNNKNLTMANLAANLRKSIFIPRQSIAVDSDGSKPIKGKGAIIAAATLIGLNTAMKGKRQIDMLNVETGDMQSSEVSAASSSSDVEDETKYEENKPRSRRNTGTLKALNIGLNAVTEEN